MTDLSYRALTPVSPSEEDALLAETSSRRLAHLIRDEDQTQTIRVLDDKETQDVTHASSPSRSTSSPS